MEINLNNEEFAEKNVAIFNGGEAGVVYNVEFRVEKKKPEDKEGYPDYKIIFKDSAGGEVDRAYYYITQESIAKNPKALVNQGKEMLHLWHAAKGKSTSVPKFSNPKEMLDLTMNMLRESMRFKANVTVDYGNDYKHESFLKTTRFVPFIEIDVVKEESKLYLKKDAKLTRLQQDVTDGMYTESGGTSEDKGWD